MSGREKLLRHISIAQHYRRSIRLDTDLGRQDALEGYVCHGTAKSVIENMARQVSGSSQEPSLGRAPSAVESRRLQLRLRRPCRGMPP